MPAHSPKRTVQVPDAPHQDVEEDVPVMDIPDAVETEVAAAAAPVAAEVVVAVTNATHNNFFTKSFL